MNITQLLHLFFFFFPSKRKIEVWQGMGLIQDTEADVMTECLRKLPIPFGFILALFFILIRFQGLR